MPKPDKFLSDTRYLLEKADILLKKKKQSRIPCVTCKKIKPIYAVKMCTECFYVSRKAKEEAREGKIWLSTDGFMKIYKDGKVRNLHRLNIENSLGRQLLRSETVKFKDSDRTNCDLENLILVGTDSSSVSFCPHCHKALT